MGRSKPQPQQLGEKILRESHPGFGAHKTLDSGFMSRIKPSREQMEIGHFTLSSGFSHPSWRSVMTWFVWILAVPQIHAYHYWLVVWTPVKNISQLGWLFPIYGKIKHVPNHQPVMVIITFPIGITILLVRKLPIGISPYIAGTGYSLANMARWRVPAPNGAS